MSGLSGAAWACGILEHPHSQKMGWVSITTHLVGEAGDCMGA